MTANLTILVVDDNSAFRSAIARLLKVAGHFPICAANGKEALETFKKQPVDLIITDILMPEKDGLEFIGQIRETLPALPIVAISGGGRALEKDCCLKIAKFFGATVLVSKPFGMDQLLSAVDAAVESSAPETVPGDVLLENSESPPGIPAPLHNISLR